MRSGAAFVGLLALVMAAVVGMVSTRSAERGSARIRIGTPDDAGGLIIRQMLNGKGQFNADAVSLFEPYPMKDCCTSTSQWALGCDALDAAVICPDAAEQLLRHDERFEIVGPCVLNSDIIVFRPGVTPRKIGVAHKRRYQERLVREMFGESCTIAPMLPAGLSYAYARGMVDGIVIDAVKAIPIEGERIPAVAGDRKVVSYVLVVRKEFVSNPSYTSFLSAFAQAVAELNDSSILMQALEHYRGFPWTAREVEQWSNTRVTFVCPSPAGS